MGSKYRGPELFTLSCTNLGRWPTILDIWPARIFVDVWVKLLIRTNIDLVDTYKGTDIEDILKLTILSTILFTIGCPENPKSSPIPAPCVGL